MDALRLFRSQLRLLLLPRFPQFTEAGHASAGTTSQVLEAGTRQTVVAWERLLASSLNVQSQDAVQKQLVAVQKTASATCIDGVSGVSFTWELKVLRGDATNTLLHDYKLVSTEVRTIVGCAAAKHSCDEDAGGDGGGEGGDGGTGNVAAGQPCSDEGVAESGFTDDDGDDDAGFEHVAAAICYKTRSVAFPDVQYLPPNAGGSESFAVYQKQLLSIGCPGPQELISAGQDVHLRVWLLCTDMGPDQVGASKLFAASLKGYATSWLLHSKCLLHQVHLVCKKQLELLESFYASIAKVVNVWRSHGNHKKLKESLGEAKLGVPPRPLKGRWGSVSNAEAFLLKCGGRHRLPGAFKQALLDKLTPQQIQEANALDDQVALAFKTDDDEAQYRLKIGKWTVAACADLASGEFWCTLEISHTTKKPLMHFMHILMKGQESARPSRRRSVHTTADDNLLLSLIKRDVKRVSQEISDTLHNGPASFDGLLSTLHDFHDLDRHKWICLAVASTLQVGAEFHNRIATYLFEYPWRVFGLVVSAFDIDCQLRVEVASELLKIARGQIPVKTAGKLQVLPDTFTLGFSQLFEGLLENAAVCGMLDPELYCFLTELSREVPLDTQEIEGMNSMIKHMSRLAPNIQLPLLSSRIQIKKTYSDQLARRDARKTIIAKAIEWHDKAKTKPDSQLFVCEQGVEAVQAVQGTHVISCVL